MISFILLALDYTTQPPNSAEPMTSEEVVTSDDLVTSQQPMASEEAMASDELMTNEQSMTSEQPMTREEPMTSEQPMTSEKGRLITSNDPTFTVKPTCTSVSSPVCENNNCPMMINCQKERTFCSNAPADRHPSGWAVGKINHSVCHITW